MYFINHDKKIIVFWFHKCGHTSLIEYFDQIKNFELYEAWNYIDSYTYIKDKQPEYLDYNLAMVVRNPIYYSISGYNHSVNVSNWDPAYREFIKHTMTNRYNTSDYTYKRHLQLVIAPNPLFGSPYHVEANNFYFHCCINPEYTFRKNIKVIQLEKINELSVFLKKYGVKTNHSVLHKNKGEYQSHITINEDIIKYWDILYRRNFDLFGYNFEKTIKELSLKVDIV
jgi:hypothetical protein